MGEQKRSNKIVDSNEKSRLTDANKMEALEIEEKTDRYPKIVFLIILNEFCERFSYYGCRTVLYIFLTEFIGLSKDEGTSIYHIFTVICYFTPIFGAIIADGFIGLYWTIVSLSILYFCGEAVLTLTSMGPLGAPSLVGPLIGLFIIAIGTGGIKPCVSAFGGNQFKPSQKKHLESFFSVFYLSINIGSTIGTLLTPVLRKDVKCFNNDCYPLAFGVPAAFMFTAIVIFLIGTKYYQRDAPKKGGNVLIQTIGCICRALLNKIRRVNNNKSHWLECADDKYSRDLITDVKALCKVLLVFIPVPIFWALYDQQGSRWTSQAQQLSGQIGSWTIKPDQFQAINPILIVAMVPLFDFLVYPLFAKCGLLKKQLPRMAFGYIFAIAAFCIAAVLEFQMQGAFNKINPPGKVQIVNLSPCQIKLDTQELQFKQTFALNEDFLKKDLKLTGECTSAPVTPFDFKKEKDSSSHLFLITVKDNGIVLKEYKYNLTDYKIGSSRVSFVNYLENSGTFNYTPILSLKKTSKEYGYDVPADIDYEQFDFKVKVPKEKFGYDFYEGGRYLFETCGRYVFFVFADANGNLNSFFFTQIYPNGLHLAWQLIQIFVMTIGEIMFSISGLSFAYSQAPASMKSVLQASWCLTVAFGNVIVVIVAEARMVDNQAYEYLAFAGLLAVATLLFVVIIFFVKFDDEKEAKSETNEQVEETKSRSVEYGQYANENFNFKEDENNSHL